MKKENEPQALRERLKKEFPSATFESGLFQGSVFAVIDVDPSSLLPMITALVSDPSWGMVLLENLSAHHKEKNLVFSYFLMNPQDQSSVCVRTRCALTAENRRVDFISIQSVLPMAKVYEEEIGSLFGVRFTHEKGQDVLSTNSVLPEGWHGFPLRKTYVFPHEFLGISHSRVKGH